MSNKQTLEEILKQLGPEDIEKLGYDEILQLRKELNPHGRIIDGADWWINLSVTNITEAFFKKLITTGVIGYVYRALDEYKVPSDIPVVPVADWLDDPSSVKISDELNKVATDELKQKYLDNEKMMETRRAIKAFLETLFEYNPDENVRSAHKPNRKDTSRKPVNTQSAKLAISQLKKKDSTFRASEEHYERLQKIKGTEVKTKIMYITGKDGKKKRVRRKMKKRITNATNKEEAKDDTIADTVRDNIPPADTFHKFTRYLESNWDELLDAVNDLYCEKPDFDMMINPYGAFKTREEAEQHKIKHKDEVIASIYTVQSGKWNVFSQHKEVRDSVDFLNKNTQVLAEMLKQKESDEKIGKELLMNNIRKKKAASVAKVGPDDPNFVKWRQQNTDLSKLGAEHIGHMASDDTPDDAIECVVWKANKGGAEIRSGAFYSKAEAPESKLDE